MNTNKEVSGFDDAGVALLNFYNFVKGDKKPDMALKALTQVTLIFEVKLVECVFIFLI